MIIISAFSLFVAQKYHCSFLTPLTIIIKSVCVLWANNSDFHFCPLSLTPCLPWYDSRPGDLYACVCEKLAWEMRKPHSEDRPFRRFCCFSVAALLSVWMESSHSTAVNIDIKEVRRHMLCSISVHGLSLSQVLCFGATTFVCYLFS